jgi:hypothetical protein
MASEDELNRIVCYKWDKEFENAYIDVEDS